MSDAEKISAICDELIAVLRNATWGNFEPTIAAAEHAAREVADIVGRLR